MRIRVLGDPVHRELNAEISPMKAHMELVLIPALMLLAVGAFVAMAWKF